MFKTSLEEQADDFSSTVEGTTPELEPITNERETDLQTPVSDSLLGRVKKIYDRLKSSIDVAFVADSCDLSVDKVYHVYGKPYSTIYGFDLKTDKISYYRVQDTWLVDKNSISEGASVLEATIRSDDSLNQVAFYGNTSAWFIHKPSDNTLKYWKSEFDFLDGKAVTGELIKFKSIYAILSLASRTYKLHRSWLDCKSLYYIRNLQKYDCYVANYNYPRPTPKMRGKLLPKGFKVTVNNRLLKGCASGIGNINNLVPIQGFENTPVKSSWGSTINLFDWQSASGDEYVKKFINSVKEIKLIASFAHNACDRCHHESHGDCIENRCTCNSCYCTLRDYGTYKPTISFPLTPSLSDDSTDDDITSIVIDRFKSSNYNASCESIFGSKVSLLRGIADFYISELLIAEGEDYSSKQDDIVLSLSTMMYNYILLSSLGEARHAASKATGFSKLVMHPLLKKSVSSSGYRQSKWIECNLLRGVIPDEEILNTLIKIFSLSWQGGYGGKAWANIAALGLDYKRQKFTAKLFIDSVCNIVHNGGWAFGKWYTRHMTCCSSHAIGLEELLTTKRYARASGELLSKVCPTFKVTKKSEANGNDIVSKLDEYRLSRRIG